ncbi:MAG TPA: hypothetical protein VFZ49_03675 [Pyrinomonadaceae bacterium]
MRALGLLLFTLLILAAATCQSPGSYVSKTSNSILATNSSDGLNQNPTPTAGNVPGSDNLSSHTLPETERKYVGCWNGMGGGRLWIRTTEIYDLGSKESSLYKEIPAIKSELEGMMSGEEYLLEAHADFPKSFLAKLVRLSYLSDGTVGFTTYKSYEDYARDKLSGQGLFGKVPCKRGFS